MIGPPVTNLRYINDYLYIVILPGRESGKNTLTFCAGVNITRFTPITRGLHGLSSNPVIRGLQRVKHGVSSLALSKGATPRAVRGNDCAGVKPSTDTWYSELLRIENAQGSLPDEIISFSVISLVEKIITGCCLHVSPPDRLLSPETLQGFLESLSTASAYNPYASD